MLQTNRAQKLPLPKWVRHFLKYRLSNKLFCVKRQMRPMNNNLVQKNFSKTFHFLDLTIPSQTQKQTCKQQPILAICGIDALSGAHFMKKGHFIYFNPLKRVFLIKIEYLQIF